MPKPHLCDPSLLARDLTGKVIVVTGANSGIGFVTAKQLASQGAHVVLACRRPAEGEERAKEIAAEHSGATTSVLKLDLGDLASVRAFAAEVSAAHPAIHGLINNAGVMNTPKGKTKDGFETQIGVNHLGHFLLTHLLLDALKQGAPSRIVNVSSCFHDKAAGREGKIHFDDMHYDSRKYDGWEAYAQSKLANVLHAKGLATRLEGTEVTAASVHPGWVRTDLARHTMPVWVQNTIARPVLRMMGMIEPWEGAQSSLHALLSDDVPAKSGAYFSQLGMYREKSANAGGWPMRSPNPEVHDEANVERLWERSEQLVGVSC